MKSGWQFRKMPDQDDMPQVATCRPGEPEFVHDPHEFYVKGKTKVKRDGHRITRTQSVEWYWCLGGHPIPMQGPIFATDPYGAKTDFFEAPSWLAAIDPTSKAKAMDAARRAHNYFVSDVMRAELMADGWVLTPDDHGNTVLTRQEIFAEGVDTTPTSV